MTSRAVAARATTEHEPTHRSTAATAGVLFVIATAFLYVGQAVYGPIITFPGYLERAHVERTTVVIGVLLEFTCVLAIPFIAIVLFPVLKQHAESLALAYVGLRLLEAVLFIGVEINLLSLLELSQEYANGSGADGPLLRIAGESIRAENDWIFSFYVLVFSIGAMVLYSVLYRSRLVPRFISAWGLASAAFLLLGTVLLMVEAFGAMSVWESELIWATPIAVNEMVLAVWLIAKGFTTSPLRPAPVSPRGVLSS